MEAKKFIEILDKHVDQAALMKDLGKEIVLPLVKEKLLAIDVIPGTDIDQKVIQKIVEYLEAQV